MKTRKQPAVYILASQKYGTLYVGVTSDLIKRVWQHKNDKLGGFTARYKVHLVDPCYEHAGMTNQSEYAGMTNKFTPG
jgi:putative endonuclease